MAELLIKAINATHIDPVKDAAGCYKRGDVVVVMPDGHEWGRCECPPKFVIVKIPDLSMAEAEKYLGSKYDTEPLVEEWVTSRYESGEYAPFISQPTITARRDGESETRQVSAEEWEAMQIEQNWSPFLSKPFVIESGDGYVVLEGVTFEYLTVEGSIKVLKTRRSFEVELANFSFPADGKVESDWNTARNFVKDKSTGIHE